MHISSSRTRAQTDDGLFGLLIQLPTRIRWRQQINKNISAERESPCMISEISPQNVWQIVIERNETPCALTRHSATSTERHTRPDDNRARLFINARQRHYGTKLGSVSYSPVCCSNGLDTRIVPAPAKKTESKLTQGQYKLPSIIATIAYAVKKTTKKNPKEK